MKVVAIIVTHNGAKWISRCLQSVKESNIPVQVIVVDNSSTDGTLEIVASSDPNAIIIKNAKNLGFGKANNIGIRRASSIGADYIFLLNQDAWILPDTIEKLIVTSLKRQDFYVISPLHLNGDGTQLDYNFSVYINAFGKFSLNDFVGELKKKEEFEVKFVNAAFWLLPKRSIAHIGGFDPIFFHYEEDGDYINRVHFHGFKVGIAAGAIGFHDRIQTPFDINSLPFKKRVQRKLSVYLLALKNINRSFLYNLSLVAKSFFKRNVTCLVRFDFQNLLIEYLVFLKLVGKISSVIDQRKECKKLQSSFL